MQNLKYIIDENNNFAIFSSTLIHADIKGLGKIVGAGFCNFFPENHGETGRTNVHCFGESISLKIKSREEDEQIINKKI